MIRLIAMCFENPEVDVAELMPELAGYAITTPDPPVTLAFIAALSILNYASNRTESPMDHAGVQAYVENALSVVEFSVVVGDALDGMDDQDPDFGDDKVL
ncbi:hypothetical protein [Subtercola endophyticus]|uniref:hypothetical protein n=1 Tax=Subtercola endophyticus TaxID=2895559 RepID=UPI001E43FB4A|nr:hypothetical protein [Subtercola endophyticus]UFS58926.1 hypothetical protein LQ955_18345 [Subtercola endophyticus]